MRVSDDSFKVVKGSAATVEPWAGPPFLSLYIAGVRGAPWLSWLSVDDVCDWYIWPLKA